MAVRTRDRRIRSYLIIPALGVVALAQSALLPHARLWGIFPNLMLVVVVSWSLLRGADQGMVWAFVGGLLLDLLSGGPTGAGTLALMAVAFLAGIGEVNIFRTHLVLPLVTVLLASLLYGALMLLILQVAGHAVDWPGSLVTTVIPSAVVNTLLTPLVYGIVYWLHRLLGRDAIDW